jgi:glycosyltransferase involved in cell wall biosynthesis
MAPKLSIVTVTKDDPSGLRATLESLAPLLSSSLDWEHIVVDGSSTELAVSAPWPMILRREAPVGIYAAMNVGLRLARGEIVWFLNGGDRLRDLSALELIVRAFQENADLDLACATADLVDRGAHTFTLYPRPTLRRSLLAGRSLCHQAMLYRRRIFDELGPFSTDYTIAADEEFLLRFFVAKKRSLCLPHRLVFFDTGGLSNRRYGERHRELARASRLLRGNVPLVDYARYAFHRRANALRAHAFGWLRALPFTAWLREGWLGWRRLTLRYH